MLSQLTELPPDPLLGLTKLFADDSRTRKLDLGVGVFRTADNKTPVLSSVRKAEARVLEAQATKVYTPAEGAPGFTSAVAALAFGADNAALVAGRITAVQTPGGCGALRIAAELLKRLKTRAIHIGSPTWPNHTPLLAAAGHNIRLIPYYDTAACRVDFDAFMAEVEKLGSQDVLLLHGACHNPTGADLTSAQIDAVISAAAQQGFLPFVDMAYHGFAEGLEEDAYILREMAKRLPEALVSYSCSKNFGLYRERTGALMALGENAKASAAVKSHMLNIARGIYSMPPAHGGAIVAEILQTPELAAEWRKEASEMREAMRRNRRMLVRAAAAMQMGDRLAYIEHQYGMFSLLPVNETQVLNLREAHGIYMAASGRFNVCGVNEGNVSHFCEALRDVMFG